MYVSPAMAVGTCIRVKASMYISTTCVQIYTSMYETLMYMRMHTQGMGVQGFRSHVAENVTDGTSAEHVGRSASLDERVHPVTVCVSVCLCLCVCVCVCVVVGVVPVDRQSDASGCWARRCQRVCACLYWLTCACMQSMCRTLLRGGHSHHRISHGTSTKCLISPVLLLLTLWWRMPCFLVRVDRGLGLMHAHERVHVCVHVCGYMLVCLRPAYVLVCPGAYVPGAGLRSLSVSKIGVSCVCVRAGTMVTCASRSFSLPFCLSLPPIPLSLLPFLALSLSLCRCVCVCVCVCVCYWAWGRASCWAWTEARARRGGRRQLRFGWYEQLLSLACACCNSCNTCTESRLD